METWRPSNVTLDLMGTPRPLYTAPEVVTLTCSPNECVVQDGKLADQENYWLPRTSVWLALSELRRIMVHLKTSSPISWNL